MADPTSDDTPTPAPGPTDPTLTYEATDQDGAGIEPLGQSGWLTATIAGTAYRLRSPLFGELKALRIHLQAVSDEIDEMNERAQAAGTALARHGQDIASTPEDDLTPAQRRKTTKLVAEARKLSRELVDQADERRLAWWTKVFETLSVDGVPADWPSWIVDINLPGKVMEHWRRVPLAPGR